MCTSCFFIWIVIDNAGEGVFEEVRKKEELIYKMKFIPVKADTNEIDEEGYIRSCWLLWPET